MTKYVNLYDEQERAQAPAEETSDEAALVVAGLGLVPVNKAGDEGIGVLDFAGGTLTGPLYTKGPVYDALSYISAADRGVDDSTGIQAAIAAAAVVSGSVYIPAGVYVLGAGLTIPSKVRLFGDGTQQTYLWLADGVDEDVVANADVSGGNSYIEIRGLTVDGNSAGQTGSGLNHGIRLTRVDHFVIDDVEVYDADGHGIRVDGQGVETSYGVVNNVVCRSNTVYGLYITYAMRCIQTTCVKAYQNGSHGVVFDHSDSQADNINARANGGYGIFIRNVFGYQFSNLKAVLNDQHGIYVQGMTYSQGVNWTANNNSQASSGTYHNFFFSGSSALSYGVTDKCIILNCLSLPQANYGTTKEGYALYVDDGCTSDLKILGGIFATGVTGIIRQPGSPGSFVLLDFPSATKNFRLWAADLAFPNGTKLGTSAAQLWGINGATPATTQVLATGASHSVDDVITFLQARGICKQS